MTIGIAGIFLLLAILVFGFLIGVVVVARKKMRTCEKCKTDEGPFWGAGCDDHGRFLFLCDPCLGKLEEEADPEPFVAYVRSILFGGSHERT